MDISIDKLRTLIVEARRIDVKEGATDPDSGSNPIDDGVTDVLADQDQAEGGADGAELEMRGLIEALNEDEQASLLALIYVGRGDFEAEEWDEALRLACERNAASGDLADYLIGMPLLGDLIDEGLGAMGETLDDEAGLAPDTEETEPDDEGEDEAGVGRSG